MVFLAGLPRFFIIPVAGVFRIDRSSCVFSGFGVRLEDRWGRSSGCGVFRDLPDLIGWRGSIVAMS